MESTSENGAAPQKIHASDLAHRIVELYWGQTADYATDNGGVQLRQNTKGQAEIVTLIADFRSRHVLDVSAPLSRARAARPNLFAQLVRQVQWKLVEMPIPRLQLVGAKYDPFVYRINWDTRVTPSQAQAPDFDANLYMVGPAGDYLVQLSGLLRPLIQAKWMDLVLRINRQCLQDPGLFDFLFGSHRVSTRRVCGSLRELQDNVCFYCGDRLHSAADVDHFLPWARWPDNGLENLVVAHPGCNSQKRDFIAAAEHLERWAQRFDSAGGLWQDLETVASECNWDRRPERTRGVARSLYLRLPDDADLWLSSNTFVVPDWAVIHPALAAP
jgi:hypothetical protein